MLSVDSQLGREEMGLGSIKEKEEHREGGVNLPA